MSLFKCMAIAVGLTVGINGLAIADIPSINYIGAMSEALMAEINTKANDNAVVHLTGDESIAGNKTFASQVTFQDVVLAPEPETDGAENQVATAGWTRSQVNVVRGQIPVGGANSDVFTTIWIEE